MSTDNGNIPKALEPYPPRGENGAPRFPSVEKSLSWWMRSRRKLVKASQADVAQRCKMARATYSAYENGTRVPDINSFIRICSALYIPYEKVIDDADWEL